jgi:hypothetical protein
MSSQPKRNSISRSPLRRGDKLHKINRNIDGSMDPETVNRLDLVVLKHPMRHEESFFLRLDGISTFSNARCPEAMFLSRHHFSLAPRQPFARERSFSFVRSNTDHPWLTDPEPTRPKCTAVGLTIRRKRYG